MSLDFPWEAFSQASQRGSQNRQKMMETLGQALAGAGQNIGTGLQNQRLLQEQLRQKKQAEDLRNYLGGLNQPQQRTADVMGSPNTPIASFNPQTEQTTPLMTTPDPQMKNMLDLIKMLPDSQLPQAVTNMGQQMAKGAYGQTKAQGAYFVDPNDPTHVSLEEFPGSIRIATTAADAGSKVTGAASGAAKRAIQRDRNALWSSSIDNRQIKKLIETVGLTPSQLTKVQVIAARANRGIDILKDGQATPQKLAAAGIDFAGIMQGGVPHVDEVANSAFPMWQQDIGRWQTYLSGEPAAVIPPAIQKEMLSMLKGVADLDYRLIRTNNDLTKKFVVPTIKGGVNPAQSKALQTMEDVMTGSGNTPVPKKATLRWNPQTQSLEPVQ